MRILVVDDEPDSLYEIGNHLKNYNGIDSYLLCSNPVEAINLAGQRSFHIALLDIEMPEINGLELARKLLDICPQISIVFITAYNHYAKEASKVKAVDFILKPFRKERLYKALDKIKDKDVR